MCKTLVAFFIAPLPSARGRVSSTTENQLSVALLSPSLHLFPPPPHAVHGHVLVFMCPLRYLPASLAPPFLSRSLSFCIIRVAARRAHLRKRARPKSARVYGSVQKKKKKNAAACAKARANEARAGQAYGLEQHRTVHVHVHRSRTDREPGEAARNGGGGQQLGRLHLREVYRGGNTCGTARLI